MNSSILLRITSQITSRCVHTSPVTLFPKRWKEKSEPPFQSELKNPIAEVYGGAEAWPENEVSLLSRLDYLMFIQGVPSIGTHFRFQFLTFLMVL